jgi:hypothetical protein
MNKKTAILNDIITPMFEAISLLIGRIASLEEQHRNHHGLY